MSDSIKKVMISDLWNMTDFPGDEHSFGMAAETIEQLRRQLGS